MKKPLPTDDWDICCMLSRVLGNGEQVDYPAARNLHSIVRMRRGNRARPSITKIWHREERHGRRPARRTA